MDLDDGAVQRYRFQFDAHDLFPLEVFKHPVEHPILRPAVHPCVNGMPVAEAGRQPSPLAALLGDIQDRVEHLQVRPATLLVRKSKSRRARTVRMHADLVQLFANWPANRVPRDKVVALAMRTALRHIADGIEWASLDKESPGTGKRRAGAHSLRHSAARHWLMVGKVPLNVVSQWLGHASVQVTLRIYLPIVGSDYGMESVP